MRFLLMLLLGWLTMASHDAAPAPLPYKKVAPQIRGFWVDGFNPGIKSRAEVDELIARVQKANCNAIFAQVRKRGDAYYWSRYEPRARDFDTIGYDPLAYLIEKAHAATPRISVHAWINMGAVGVPFAEEHVLAKHPDWRSVSDTGEGDDKESIKIDPGVPGAADWTFRVYMDVLRQYPVDGIHFDFVRYGGPRWGYAPESIARFNARHKKEGKPEYINPDWQEWRREQVTNIVRKVYVNAASVRPDAIISAATIAWGDGPKSEGEWQQSAAYSQVYQDWRSWLEEGILDIACPMTYFRIDPNRSYQENWATWIKGHQYHRAATLAVGAFLNTPSNTLDLAKINLSPATTGTAPAGILFYCYSQPSLSETDKEAFFSSLTSLFPEPAPFPELSWKKTPTTGHVKGVVTFGAELAPVDGGMVTLTENGGKKRSLVRPTDGTGFYAFTNLPPGDYTVSVKYQDETGISRQVSLNAGEVASADFRLSGGDLPAARTVHGIGALSEGERILLDSCLVTTGTASLGGDRCFVADSAGNPAVEVRFSKPLLLPFVSGDRITLTATLKREDGRPYLQVDGVILVGMD